MLSGKRGPRTLQVTLFLSGGGGAQDPDSLVSDSGGKRSGVGAAAEETAGSQQSLGGRGGAGLRSPSLVGEGS